MNHRNAYYEEAPSLVMDEDELLREFNKARQECRIKYFALDLVAGGYDPATLARKAAETGQRQALGFLSEICANALPENFVQTRKELEDLVKGLEGEATQNEFLVTGLPDFGKKAYENMPEAYNVKWRVICRTSVEEMRDWFDIYLRVQNVTPR